MPYTELIRQEGEYNYSANIQFDIENDYKLGRFIPNETTVSLIKEYFIDIAKEKPNCHSRILYGSYGTGKSHFLTVLSLLLSKAHIGGDGYKTFLARVNELDADLAADIDSFVSNGNRKPFLVVPVVFDFEDFDRCLYFSLKKKLQSVGIKVSFKTFYDQALSLIEQWKQSDESLKKLEVACKVSNVTIGELENMLIMLDNNAESLFQSVFSEMTYGVKYIYEVTNFLDVIAQANKTIESQYSGIVFIFDEFGRYIEDNIKKIKVKAVQDLAEFCDHCDGNNHIILVSHKEISQYTERYGKNIASEWKKVEGRYKATPINDKQDQCLSLIRNILIKNQPTWDEFKERHQAELNGMYAEASDFKGFLVDVARGENPFEGGFPLHPISLFALDKLSKKVAQNERTFFTYLASKEDNSLYSFLLKTQLDEFHFVGIDEIYDYFEPSIKAIQSDSGYEWYKNLQAALSKCHMSSDSDSPEAKLLKVITVIGIVNDASTFSANKSTLLSVIDCPNEILENALIGLCESRILKYSGSYDRYEFYEASIYDVEAMIEEKSQEIKDEVVVNTLNEEFIDFALYPNDYNRNYKISRVFVPIYATIDTISKKTVTNKLGQYYDGVLFMLLGHPDTDVEAVCFKSREIERSIIHANLNAQQLNSIVKKYIAAKFFESQKAEYIKNDPSFEKELHYFKRELSSAIFTLLHEWKNHNTEESFIAVDGRVCTHIKNSFELSHEASNICQNIYSNTLIVNNELINKNNVSGSISAARKNAIAGALKGNKPDEYYGVPYLSPDFIAVRSVLVKNGFIAEINDVEQNVLFNGEHPQYAVKNVLQSFIETAQQGVVSLSEVYTTLKKPPFGLRDGYLSLLIAHTLLPFRKSLIISSHDVEQELTAELFEEIVKRPHDYNFTIAAWSSEQIDFLDSLEQIFEGYINSAALGRNKLKAVYEAMLSHYKNVSKFARTTKLYASESMQNYRKLMEKNNTNYSKFFFKWLTELGSEYGETVDIIKGVKIELESAIESLANDLADSVCEIFGVPNTTSLAELLSKAYKEKWEEKRKKSFDYYTNAFLEFANGVQFNERDFVVISRLAKTITGLELVYWSDNHKAEFINRLKDINSTLDKYCESTVLTEGETRMTLVTASGQEKSIIFDRNELSGLSKVVKNKINSTFGNYGLAISYDEKVQVLLSLLEDLLEGK